MKWTPGYKVIAASYEVSDRIIDRARGGALDVVDGVGDAVSSVGSAIGSVGSIF